MEVIVHLDLLQPQLVAAQAEITANQETTADLVAAEVDLMVLVLLLAELGQLGKEITEVLPTVVIRNMVAVAEVVLEQLEPMVLLVLGVLGVLD
jgi:hypothetical protein